MQSDLSGTQTECTYLVRAFERPAGCIEDGCPCTQARPEGAGSGGASSSSQKKAPRKKDKKKRKSGRGEKGGGGDGGTGYAERDNVGGLDPADPKRVRRLRAQTRGGSPSPAPDTLGHEAAALPPAPDTPLRHEHLGARTTHTATTHDAR